jgi:DMSO/TMAO reductase YedYZ molybdopterin-dependent catalytic subunit
VPLIPRETNPPCLETPAAALTERVTPNELFFVRNHFATPQINAATWRLRIEGLIDRPREWTLADIQKMPAVTRAITMECAGNSRQALTPKVHGISWDNGAVGHAEWTGVPLSVLLDDAGVSPTAIEVILEGADSDIVSGIPTPIAFSRSLPLAKARGPDVLLAYRMNGLDLSPEHGWPLRAIVGGWYGMASVKWLSRICVTDKPFDGHWQTTDYSYYERMEGVPTLRPIQAMQVKSLILRPEAGEKIPQGFEYRIEGRAWAGEHAVEKVELSFDDGASWQATMLSEGVRPLAWVRWEYIWRPAKAGSARIMVRATDTAGNAQPMTRDPDRRSYMINHIVSVEISVR